jgi:hypothetical protein
LPRGRQLVTLQDAGTHITKLPKAEHDTEEWRAAMQALLLVAEHGGPTMLARIGVMRALNRQVERVFNSDRKDHHRGRRKAQARNVMDVWADPEEEASIDPGFHLLLVRIVFIVGVFGTLPISYWLRRMA